MFSFFVKKKNSPDTPEEAIPGPESHPEGNDFIFIERRNQPSPVPNSQQSGIMYPPMPEIPMYPPIRGGPVRVNSLPVNYLEDVPFQLAPELCQEDTLDITQMMVDGIFAVMTKQLQLEEYEFTLEREIVSQ